MILLISFSHLQEDLKFPPFYVRPCFFLFCHFYHLFLRILINVCSGVFSLFAKETCPPRAQTIVITMATVTWGSATAFLATSDMTALTVGVNSLFRSADRSAGNDNCLRESDLSRGWVWRFGEVLFVLLIVFAYEVGRKNWFLRQLTCPVWHN